MDNQPPKTFLSHPQQARLAWHDAKKHATLLRLLEHNLTSGTYGPLPDQAKDALRSMGLVIETHSLLIDALSILSRYENQALTWNKTWVEGERCTESIAQHAGAALAGRTVEGQAVDAQLEGDPVLLPYLTYALVATSARLSAQGNVSLRAKYEDGRTTLELALRGHDLPAIPDQVIATACTLSHTEEPWLAVSATLAAIEAVVQTAGGTWSIKAKSPQEIIIQIVI